LTNLHGDVAATIDVGLTTPAFTAYDEFGMPLPGQDAQRYGWLGGKQRSGETLGGVILMGVRLYSPSLGRFLQVDPVPGGSATAYDYCNADPVNCTDLDGRWPSWNSIKKGLNVVAKVAEVASFIPGPIGAASAAISAGCYAGAGNWRKAGEMALTAAAGLVGAGPVVKIAFAAAAAVKVAKVGLAAKGAAKGIGFAAAVVRNPWGRRGSPAHVARILHAEAKLAKRGFRTVSGGSLKERAVPTVTAAGRHRTRYPDLVMRKPGYGTIAVQVGRATRGGRPVWRERAPLRELRGTGRYRHVFYLKY
jgi:RHS repeat-associated protein